ncbi:MAG TPA: response regulator [Nitrososphaera sp.]|jgi:DNA-binding response OmpR family regulator
MNSGSSSNQKSDTPHNAVKILIVDDEPDIATLLSIGLSKEGFVVDTFQHPELALSKFKPGYYQLSLLDIKMPIMNGFQLYRRLKEKDPALPVCFMTAFEIYPEEYQKVFPQHDVRAFIKKPVALKALQKIIRDILQNEFDSKSESSSQ